MFQCRKIINPINKKHYKTSCMSGVAPSRDPITRPALHSFFISTNYSYEAGTQDKMVSAACMVVGSIFIGPYTITWLEESYGLESRS